MTDLSPIKTSFGTEDRRWLRDIHGLTDTIGVTLDGDLFPVARFPDGTVPSGTVLAVITAVGANQRLAGPYDPAAVNGLQNPLGHLLDVQKVLVGRKVSVAVLDHGGVLRNKLASNSGLDPAAEAKLPRVRYTNG